MKSTFEIIGGAAKKASADLLLIGGYALQVYGYARQTLDVDCLVVSSDANSLRELLCLETYAPIAETGNFIRFQSDSVYLMDIDILLVDRSTMQAMLAESKPCRLQGVDFRTPSLLHLIALKLHAIANNPKRLNRDLADVQSLLRINADEVDVEGLVSIVTKFAPEGVAQQLLEGLG